MGIVVRLLGKPGKLTEHAYSVLGKQDIEIRLPNLGDQPQPLAMKREGRLACLRLGRGSAQVQLSAQDDFLRNLGDRKDARAALAVAHFVADDADKGVGIAACLIGPALFSILVLMTIVTTFMATPLFEAFYGRRARARGELGTLSEDKETSNREALG